MVLINDVTLHCTDGMGAWLFSVCNQQPRPTQPGHPS